MKKSTKVLIGVFAGVLIFAIISLILVTMWWNGAFNKLDVRLDVRDIALYENSEDTYTLIFQQLGDPEWSFGATNVRLILKDEHHNKVGSLDMTVQNDGGSAYAGNVKSVEWKSDGVIIILQASEMPDKTVEIPY